MKTEQQLYEDRGYEEVYDVLVEGFKIPPSFEVFKHGFDKERKQQRKLGAKPLTRLAYATALVESKGA